MMYGWGHGSWLSDNSGWMIFGWLWMLIIWLIPLFIALALVKYIFGKRTDNADKNPQELLDEAYARGELDRDTYLLKKQDLADKAHGIQADSIPPHY